MRPTGRAFYTATPAAPFRPQTCTPRLGPRSAVPLPARLRPGPFSGDRRFHPVHGRPRHGLLRRRVGPRLPCGDDQFADPHGPPRRTPTPRPRARASSQHPAHTTPQPSPLRVAVDRRLSGPNGSISFIDAGHGHWFILDAEGIRAISAVGNIPIGIDPAIDYAPEQITLERGDRLVLFSDGIVEQHASHRRRVRPASAAQRGADAASDAAESVIRAASAQRDRLAPRRRQHRHRRTGLAGRLHQIGIVVPRAVHALKPGDAAARHRSRAAGDPLPRLCRRSGHTSERHLRARITGMRSWISPIKAFASVVSIVKAPSGACSFGGSQSPAKSRISSSSRRIRQGCFRFSPSIPLVELETGTTRWRRERHTERGLG